LAVALRRRQLGGGGGCGGPVAAAVAAVAAVEAVEDNLLAKVAGRHNLKG
jgi:hypothetical protein